MIRRHGSAHAPVAMMFAVLFSVGSGSIIAGPGDDLSLGLPPVLYPSDNPNTPEKVALGRRLFFDKRLSSDNSVSCATCHDPTAGFSDPHAVSIGVKGRQGERNSTTILNVVFATPLMWDGKAPTLEEQSMLPFLSPNEFDLPPDDAVTKLRQQGYSQVFQEVFGEDVTRSNLAKALAAYQRSLLAGDSPFDRYLFKHDSTAISMDAREGFDVFLKAKCDACHLIMTSGFHPFSLPYVMFTDDKFHNLGVGTNMSTPDPGRYGVTGNIDDWGRFRTPSLRNVALTAPYFHDGSAATLADVVEFYNKGGLANRNLDPALKPLGLSDREKLLLVRFLESLTTSGAAVLADEARRATPN